MKMNWIILMTLGILTTLQCCTGQTLPPLRSYSIGLETDLRRELFIDNNYSVLQRPSENVIIWMSLTILTVNDLNIKNQALSISGYLVTTWEDKRLDWSTTSNTTQDYSNVQFLFSNEEYVWRPPLSIVNSIQDIGIISDKSTPIRISPIGTLFWSPPGVYEVSCESDITYYPLDTQECTIKVSSWAYTQNEVKLRIKGLDPVDLSFYTENGEWDLISTNAADTIRIPLSGITFSSVSFYIKLQRRPLFHIINTLFPVALMAVLIAMVFKLPVDSGEKIGFSLTVLLAYAVYLTMISENIPSTSVAVCFLSVYLALILTLAALSVILTILVLSLHFKTDEDKMPKWVENMTNRCLIKIACMGKCGNCTRTSKVDNAERVDKTTVTTIKVEEKANAGMETNNEDGYKGLTWQQLSKIMDNVFFNLYMFTIVSVTIVLLLAIFVHYYKS